MCVCVCVCLCACAYRSVNQVSMFDACLMPSTEMLHECLYCNRLLTMSTDETEGKCSVHQHLYCVLLFCTVNRTDREVVRTDADVNSPKFLQV